MPSITKLTKWSQEKLHQPQVKSGDCMYYSICFLPLNSICPKYIWTNPNLFQGNIWLFPKIRVHNCARQNRRQRMRLDGTGILLQSNICWWSKGSSSEYKYHKWGETQGKRQLCWSLGLTVEVERPTLDSLYNENQKLLAGRLEIDCWVETRTDRDMACNSIRTC